MPVDPAKLPDVEAKLADVEAGPDRDGAAPVDDVAATSDGVRPTRQCSRCRGVFPSDPTLFFTGEYQWWLCPPCEAALMGPSRLTVWKPAARH